MWCVCVCVVKMMAVRKSRSNKELIVPHMCSVLLLVEKLQKSCELPFRVNYYYALL